MLVEINPKLPMRNKAVTQDYYVNQLGFELFGNNTYDDYLMVCKDHIQLHFFIFKELDPTENYGQVYIRTTGIDQWYEWLVKNKVAIHPNGHLTDKPWGQREFALLDPDHNLLTFGEPVASQR